MGELMGNGQPTHDQINFQSTQNIDNVDPGKIETDVQGIFADGTKNGFPVFNVQKNDFFENMRGDRKRLRFTKDSTVSGYLKGSRYNKPFWISYKDDSTGEHFIRKVK